MNEQRVPKTYWLPFGFDLSPPEKATSCPGHEPLMKMLTALCGFSAIPCPHYLVPNSTNVTTSKKRGPVTQFKSQEKDLAFLGT